MGGIDRGLLLCWGPFILFGAEAIVLSWQVREGRSANASSGSTSITQAAPQVSVLRSLNAGGACFGL